LLKKVLVRFISIQIGKKVIWTIVLSVNRLKLFLLG
jgi:hypothetical protein